MIAFLGNNSKYTHCFEKNNIFINLNLLHLYVMYLIEYLFTYSKRTKNLNDHVF